MCKVSGIVSVSIEIVLGQHICYLTQNSEENVHSQKESRYKGISGKYRNTGA